MCKLNSIKDANGNFVAAWYKVGQTVCIDDSGAIYIVVGVFHSIGEVGDDVYSYSIKGATGPEVPHLFYELELAPCTDAGIKLPLPEYRLHPPYTSRWHGWDETRLESTK